jgi:hypothetical protein
MAAAVRLGLLLLALLLAGCTQPTTPQAQPSGPGLVLPPSVLFDRTSSGTLQLYVHAKQGNVRLDWANVTLRGDFHVGNGTNATGTERTESFERRYAVDLDLGAPRVNVTLEAIDRGARYTWSGRVLLNDTVATRVHVQPWTAEGWSRPLNATLPFETYLARAEASP